MKINYSNVRIAVVDDRGSVVDEFEELFNIELPEIKVEKFETTDAALAAIERGGEWAFWIVDLMMPIGKKLGKIETEDGLSTGIVLIKRLLKSNVSISGAIIAFSLRDVTQSDFGSEHEITVLPKKENTIMDVVVRVRDALLNEERKSDG